MRTRSGTVRITLAIAILPAAIFAFVGNLHRRAHTLSPRPQRPAAIPHPAPPPPHEDLTLTASGSFTQWPAPTPIPSPPSSVQFVLTDLGTLGGEGSEPTAINNAGDVVGSAQLSDGRWHAFLWKNGRMRDLGTLGGLESRACSINNLDQVAGSAQSHDGKWHAFLWSRGRMRRIGSRDSGEVATHIDDRGQALLATTAGDDVGSQSCPPGDLDGPADLLWEWGRTHRLLDIIHRPRGRVDNLVMNNRGQLAGNLAGSADDLERGPLFFWNGLRLRMLPLEDSWTVADALTDGGQLIVEQSAVDGRWSESFLLKNGSLTDLVTGGVTAMNSQGVALCENASEEGVLSIYSHGERKYPSYIPHLGNGRLDSLAAINDRGQIAGVRSVEGFTDHAYRLSAVSRRDGGIIPVTYHRRELPPPTPRREDPWTWKLVRRVQASDESIGPAAPAFSPDSGLFAAADGNGKIRTWRTRDWQFLRTISIPRSEQSPRIAFSSDGTTLEMRLDGQPLRSWDVRDGRLRQGQDRSGIRGNGSGDRILSPDGHLLLSYEGSDVSIRDRQSGSVVRKIRTTENVRSAVFSGDGKLAIGGCGEVQVWDTRRWRLLWRFGADFGAPVVFSPEGDLLLCANERSEDSVWDLKTHTASTIPNHQGDTLLFSPDGRNLVTNSPDRNCDRNKLDILEVPRE